jgi:hypothetical protein
MISDRQSFRPSEASLKMVEDCARKLSPQSQALAQWHGSYVSNHKLCDIETQKLSFADDSFDAVVFNELFEHLRINPCSAGNSPPACGIWPSGLSLSSVRLFPISPPNPRHGLEDLVF